MGVRPPSDDGSDSPESIEFGIAALEPHLSRAELSYPASVEEVVTALGDPEIPYDPNGNSVALSSVADGVDRRRFDSRRELLDALHPEFERYRRNHGGLFSKLQSLVPGL